MHNITKEEEEEGAEAGEKIMVISIKGSTCAPLPYLKKKSRPLLWC